MKHSLLCAVVMIALPLSVSAQGSIEYNRDIRPILSGKCFECHGPDGSHRKANLRLDTEEGAKKALVRGKPAESEIFARITAKEADKRMPPPKTGKTLTQTEVELIRRWLEEGAPYQLHWTFAPLQRPAVPQALLAPVHGQKKWPTNPIDHFILARLALEKREPSPEADRITLFRRLHLDLIGLPPTAKQVDEFLTDQRPDAYEHLVDRLLASPHFGERMAMHWLDLVRYADTVGYHGDQEHHISPYRDYVIKAFNDNMPFDRFTIEQLAGDLLPSPTTDQRIATGYNRVLQTTHEGGAQDKEYLAKYSADRVRNVSAVWMGATMGCAECHNHRYDPYTQKDFYRLAAFFADIDERGAFKGPDVTPTKRPPEIEVLSPIDREEAGALRRHIERLKRIADEQPKAKDIAGEIARNEKALAEIEKRKRMTMVTVAIPPRVIRVLHRGDWMDITGEIVQPAVPHFLKQVDTKDRRATRLDLARWLTSPDHPQTARVYVNRLWQLMFGSGISKNLEDTGSQGDWPSHPELLDWLAAEFVVPTAPAGAKALHGWNVKHVIKLLVTSRTYRQSSQASDALRKADPDNRLYARQARFRLPAEMLRDGGLVVSGLLTDRLGGRGAKPYQPDGYYAHLNFPKRTYVADQGAEQYRRGVYTHWQRTYLHPMLRAFDAPTREECTAQRAVSNTPLAALSRLNDPSVVEFSRMFAVRILRHGGASDADRLTWAWREAVSRHPDKREARELAQFLQQQRKEFASNPTAAGKLLTVGQSPRSTGWSEPELAAWTSVARVLLNLHETITRD